MPLPMTEVEGAPSRSDIRDGMAYFLNTGPFGAKCGGCAHRGYHRKTECYNGTTGEYETRTRKVTSCAMFLKMTGRHGGLIDENWDACKYFEKKPSGK